MKMLLTGFAANPLLMKQKSESQEVPDGGYMTCLALTKGAGFWTHGFAGSSVTDLAFV